MNKKIKNIPICEIKKELVRQCYNSYKSRECMEVVGSNVLVEEYENDLGLRAFIFINHSKERPYISLVVRGSDETIDWVQNLNVRKAPLYSEDVDEKHKQFARVSVHNGYRNVFYREHIGLRIIDKIAALCAEYRYYGVYLSGHSMGGAILQIFAYKLFCDKNIKPVCIVFGAPLNIGDKHFQKLLIKKKIFIIHYNVSGDIVPYLLTMFYPSEFKPVIQPLKNTLHKSIIGSHSISYYMQLILDREQA